MRSPRAGRVTWWCRIADRTGVTSERPGLSDSGETAGLLAWLVRRHVERCERCRAERARWEGVVAALKESRRIKAPYGTLERVFARIAAEREAEAAQALRPMLPGAVQREGLSGGWLAGLSLASSWAGAFLGASPWLLGFGERVVALTHAAAAMWSKRLWEEVLVLQHLGEALPAAAQPYFQALWWSAVGCSAAMALLVIAAEYCGSSKS